MPEPPPLAPTAEPVPPPPELVQPPPEVAPQPPVPAPPVPQPVPVPAEPEPAPAPPPPAEPAAPPLLATPPPPLQPPPLQPLAPKPLPPKPPAPRPPPRPTPKPAPAPSAPKFGDYFFIPPAPSSRQSRNGRTGGPIDLSLGPVDHYTQAPPRRNANDSTSDIQVTGAQVGSDWIDQLHRWWIENRHYPREAAENGEAGTVQIRVKVNRTGKVLEVELLSRSGSTWLDAASLATFRGRMLPPFPTNTPENEAMLTLTINYLLYHN